MNFNSHFVLDFHLPITDILCVHKEDNKFYTKLTELLDSEVKTLVNGLSQICKDTNNTS